MLMVIRFEQDRASLVSIDKRFWEVYPLVRRRLICTLELCGRTALPGNISLSHCNTSWVPQYPQYNTYNVPAARDLVLMLPTAGSSQEMSSLKNCFCP